MDKKLTTAMIFNDLSLDVLRENLNDALEIQDERKRYEALGNVIQQYESVIERVKKDTSKVENAVYRTYGSGDIHNYKSSTVKTRDLTADEIARVGENDSLILQIKVLLGVAQSHYETAQKAHYSITRKERERRENNLVRLSKLSNEELNMLFKLIEQHINRNFALKI